MNCVFDIDGTICFDYMNVSEEGTQLLEKLEEAGHHVMFASARPIRDMLPVLKERYRNYTLIGGNGSIISQNNQIVDVCLFEPTLLKSIMEVLEDESVVYLADGKWDFSYNGDGVMKLIVLEAEDMNRVHDRLSDLPVSFYRHESTDTLDILAFKTSKYDVLKRLGIDDYIAMGNDVNDIEMLDHANPGIMINFNERLAPYADYQVDYDEHYLNTILEIIENHKKTV
ncbi:HAD-IIB family hydrolase [Erysipelothrix piscisicarius]|uniref:HAD-IIB family hydrolase n=1 Tax=Erysipelothrix piscisicarius TaxID=2485784 RepID=A0A3S5HK87_9FIRM|nr:HAD-IIB family hydrolase [Erysipelothrix piscisicarius]AZK43908.1 HAD-IIB family hydrolase [Erysipelothrix piscisicarius]